MTLTPAQIGLGNVISNQTHAFTIANRESLKATLTKYAKREAKGIEHAAPVVPHDLLPGQSEGHTVRVSRGGPLEINAALQFDWEFNVQPMVDARNGYGPMIYNGLITNAYHPEVGRGGYFHPNSGTSEGQGVMILAAFLAYEALSQREEDLEVAEYYRELAITMLDAMGDGDYSGAMLRQPFPDNPDTITLLHWLFAGKGPVSLQNVVLDYAAAVGGSRQIVIPASALGSGYSRVWTVYPASAQLLYASPFSPVINGEGITINEGDLSVDGNGNLVIQLPAGTATGDYKVVYAYYSEQTLPLGSAYEAYPVWTAIKDGYSACAPDTFRWFDMALNKAIAHGRDVDVSNWVKLRNGLRRTVVKGQDLTDLREVIKPLPGIDVFDTDGMFCFAIHRNAMPPPPPLDQGWIGFNFWRRDRSSGDIVGTIPVGFVEGDVASTGQVQIGRGFEDTWREPTVYQEADQFLLVELGMSFDRAVYAGKGSTDGDPQAPVVTPFMSTTREYDPATRYHGRTWLDPDLTDYESAYTPDGRPWFRWDWSDPSETQALLFPINLFRNSLGKRLTAGTTLLNFGIDVAAPNHMGFTIRLRRMRLVSGPSAQWVFDNYEEAVKGSQLPYFPGAIPFATNADIIGQEFVGYNGNPFHGYQLPDLWLELEEDAKAVHGSLTSGDLPTADINTGATIYPISMVNANGVPKPLNIALMEQQCLFLRDAALVYERDLGIKGPFAHTFVLNTPARHNIGSPRPHTWVYTNDDPNTRWVGYQVRIVESLAYLVHRTTGRVDAVDVRDVCLTMTRDWLVWLNGAWPDLNGKIVNGVRYYGMPTDFDAHGAPETLYEETHAPAIILRACMYLKLASPADAALCDTIMQRCWDYLEMNWRTSGEMRYTWSPDPAARVWYGFWHGEIIWTLSDLLMEGAPARPAGIPAETVRDRLRQTQTWMEEVGIVDGKHRLMVRLNGIRAANVTALPNWSGGYEVGLEYKTDMFQSQSGKPQRRELRATPRKTIDYTTLLTGEDLRDFQTTLSLWQNRPFVNGEITRSTRTLTTMGPGADSVLVQDVPDWLVRNSWVMLINERARIAEVRKVSRITGKRVSFSWATTELFPAGTRLCPGLIGQLQASLQMQRSTSAVAQAGISFSVDPGSEPAINPGVGDLYYDGVEVFLLKPNWANQVDLTHDFPVTTMDTGHGRIEHIHHIDFPSQIRKATFLARNRAQAEHMMRFFSRMKGRRGEVFVPSREEDLPLAQSVVGGTYEVLVRGTRNVRLLFESTVFRYIAICLSDGRVIPNLIVGHTLIGSNTRVAVRDPWPENFDRANVQSVCWMPLCTLASDGVTITWLSDQVAQYDLSFETQESV